MKKLLLSVILGVGYAHTVLAAPFPLPSNPTEKERKKICSKSGLISYLKKQVGMASRLRADNSARCNVSKVGPEEAKKSCDWAKKFCVGEDDKFGMKNSHCGRYCEDQFGPNFFSQPLALEAGQDLLAIGGQETEKDLSSAGGQEAEKDLLAIGSQEDFDANQRNEINKQYNETLQTFRDIKDKAIPTPGDPKACAGVKKEYQKRALLWHPDKQKGKDIAFYGAVFGKITDALRVVGCK